MIGVGPTELLIIGLIVMLTIVPLWKILGKAGYNGALSLLILIPGVGPLLTIGLMLFLAFSTWPIEKKLTELQAESSNIQTTS